MSIDLNKVLADVPATVEDLFKQWGWDTEARSAEFRDFDESQHPRGPDGKFTDSGGGADDNSLLGSSPSSADILRPSKKDIEGLPKGWHRDSGGAVIKDGEPYTRIVDLQGNPVPAAIVQQISDLQSKYPIDVASLKVQIAYTMSDDEGGVTTNVPVEPHGDYSIDLNAHLFQDSARGEKLRAMWDENTTEHNALMPSSVGNIGQYCITHEYGHVVDFTGGIVNPRIAQMAYGQQVVSNAQEDLVNATSSISESRLTKSMSDYAQSSLAEAMAEGFAEHVMTDGKTTSEFSKLVWKAYQAAGVVK